MKGRRHPPHISLRALRTASGMSLEQVATAVTEVLGAAQPVSRGTISAIELGIRGVSQQMLAAIATVYGLQPGDIVTDYDPRSSRVHKSPTEDLVEELVS